MQQPPVLDHDDAMERLRYPIGRFHARSGLSIAERQALIEQIAALPAELGAAVSDLARDQLDTPYRTGGWTVRQVVHHVPDSHMNAYVRFKLALTEDEPAIKGYDEAAWAELPEARAANLAISLALLEALHRRWTLVLSSLGDEQFARSFQHPELGRVTLEKNLQLYAWHGRHHVAHITTLRERKGW